MRGDHVEKVPFAFTTRMEMGRLRVVVWQGGGPGLATPLPKELVQRRKQANPREKPGETDEPTEYP